MSQTRIIPCTCSHSYQDRKYGSQMRVHNETKAGPQQPPGHRCTVCGNVKILIGITLLGIPWLRIF
jgi:hypothetical protein